MQAFPTNIPLQQISFNGDVKLFVLRLDLIDHYTGGNKHFKLKYNLEEAQKQGYKKILSFGGAWSNHLAALTSEISRQVAGGSKQQKVIGVIRGEEPKELSVTLNFCREKGMQLHFVSREDYRKKNDEEFIDRLKHKFGDFYLVPEGASNELAVKGCKEIVDLIEIDFDHICCPVGSGGTLAGIASGLKSHQKALGFVTLKGGEYLEDVVAKLINSAEASVTSIAEWPPLQGEKKETPELIHTYHFGGFAKTTPELIAFKKDFEKQFGFELDYMYTSKMFYGIFDLIKKDYFKKGETIVAIHTGGLQGNKGFED